MSKIKFDVNLMKYLQVFESVSRTSPKDCIDTEDFLIFIVNEGFIGKAIGKAGANVKKLEGMFRRKLKVVEYADDVTLFVRNYLLPLKITDCNFENGVITVVAADSQQRGQILGRDRKNLNQLKEVTSRYFEFEDMKVA